MCININRGKRTKYIYKENKGGVFLLMNPTVKAKTINRKVVIGKMLFIT